MTNQRQVSPIYSAVTARDPLFKPLRCRYLLKSLVHHVACGIFIERSSDPDCFRPRLVACSLFYAAFLPNLRIGTFYEPLSKPTTSANAAWLWSESEALTDAIKVINEDAIPKLKLLSEIEGYSTLLSGGNRWYREDIEDRMIVHIANGDLEAARAIWHERQLWHAGKSFPPGTRADRWRLQLAAVAEPLMAGDRPALAKILHDWEAANVRGTELEPYWEPTPFPLER